MRKLLRRVGLISTVAAVALAGCGKHRPDTAVGPDLPTTLKVDNQAYSDMKIYVINGGQRVRLGTATGNSETSFTIPKYLVRTLVELRFLADPIGGRHAPVSQGITINPGDEVLLQIPPN